MYERYSEIYNKLQTLPSDQMGREVNSRVWLGVGWSTRYKIFDLIEQQLTAEVFEQLEEEYDHNTDKP
jgi:hypothetical protein